MPTYEVQMLKTFLRIGSVVRVTGLPKATVYAEVGKGKFPKPIKIGKRSSAWLESEVAEWQKARIAERDATVRR